MRSKAVVIDSNPDAQLRCTVTAGTDCGIPARSAITRAIFAESIGWQTQPNDHLVDEPRDRILCGSAAR